MAASIANLSTSLIHSLPSPASIVDALPEPLARQIEKVTFTHAAVAVVIALAGRYVALNVLEIGTPEGVKRIPKISFLSYFLQSLKNRNVVKTYNSMLREILENHGIVRMTGFGNETIVQVGSPKFFYEAVANLEGFPKVHMESWSPDTIPARVNGTQIVSSNGATWMRHRRIANPAFHRSLKTDVFGEVALAAITQIEKARHNGAYVDVVDIAQRMTLDALGKAVFGFNFDSLENPDNEVVRTYNAVAEGSGNPFTFLFPALETHYPFRNVALRKSIDDLDAVIYKIIDDKTAYVREHGVKDTHEADLLTLMIQAAEADFDDNGKGEAKFTRKELKDNAYIFMVAGHDTTSTAITCALHYFAKHQDLQSRARDEITAVVGAHPIDSRPPIPSSEEIQQFDFLDRFIKETLRLCPPAFSLPRRRTPADIPLGPYIIPKNAFVMFNMYSIHHNEEYWGPDVEEFKPDRFDTTKEVDAEHDKVDNKFKFVPFSYGPRSCIGINFTLIEQKVVLSMILHKYNVFLPENSSPDAEIQFGANPVLLKAQNERLRFEPRY